MTTRRRGELPSAEEDLLGIHQETDEEIAEQEAADAEKREERRVFLMRLLNDSEFRAWLWEILVSFNTFETVFGAGPTGYPDAQATIYNMGLRAAGWHIWTLFDDAAPELAGLMRREAKGQP